MNLVNCAESLKYQSFKLLNYLIKTKLRGREKVKLARITIYLLVEEFCMNEEKETPPPLTHKNGPFGPTPCVKQGAGAGVPVQGRKLRGQGQGWILLDSPRGYCLTPPVPRFAWHFRMLCKRGRHVKLVYMV